MVSAHWRPRALVIFQVLQQPVRVDWHANWLLGAYARFGGERLCTDRYCPSEPSVRWKISQFSGLVLAPALYQAPVVPNAVATHCYIFPCQTHVTLPRHVLWVPAYVPADPEKGARGHPHFSCVSNSKATPMSVLNPQLPVFHTVEEMEPQNRPDPSPHSGRQIWRQRAVSNALGSPGDSVAGGSPGDTCTSYT